MKPTEELASMHGLTWPAVAYRMRVKGMTLHEALTEPKRAYSKNSPQKIAERAGIKKYVGEPCHLGHNGLRITASGLCVTCHRELSNKSRDRIKSRIAESSSKLSKPQTY